MAKKLDLKKLYFDWYSNFITNGGTGVTNLTEPFPLDGTGWKLAVDGETIIPKYKTKALNIIVPADAAIILTTIGDHNIYYLADYTVKSKGGYIPKYTDM